MEQIKICKLSEMLIVKYKFSVRIQKWKYKNVLHKKIFFFFFDLK